MAGKVRELIGDLALDDTLTELGREAREADAAAGWDSCHWRPNVQADVDALNGKLTKPCVFLMSLPRWLTWDSSPRTASPSDIGTLAAAGARNSLGWGGHSRQLTQHGA